ncbi:hypothetical protein BXZ70DRAFT_999217 [Cristinia sonorae]|uniref:3-carboxymuconate cyclase n=1 Tax=Cristinia sonorae TaxID=1940300 RepID=A0A8K0XS34_9AGAR|nr:hypothetical protein BXZ70DRAFT_999217 [Cristinia sonorae]
MKFTALLVYVLGAIAVAQATPAPADASVSARGVNSAKVGAAYFLTNEPSGNMVMVARLGPSGHVDFKTAVSTGGRGAHVTGGTGPDPLASQGAIRTSASGQFLAAVNAGSNTVSLFAIDPQDPTEIKQIGNAAFTEGNFPNSVAINKKGTQVCVLNAGLENGVNCYKVDGFRGLIPQAETHRRLNIASDAGPMAVAAHEIAFNDANDKLVVSVVGTPGFLAVWDVAPNGALSKNFTTIAPPPGGMNPFSLTAVHNTNAFVSADPAIGVDFWDLSSLSPASVGGNQTASGRSIAVPVNGQRANCWSAFSPQTGNYYLVDAGNSVVTEVKLNGADLIPSVVNQYPQTNGAATIDADIAHINGKDFLYVLAPMTTSIDVLSLNGPGNAKAVGSFNFAEKAKQLGVTITPANLQGMATFVKA